MALVRTTMTGALTLKYAHLGHGNYLAAVRSWRINKMRKIVFEPFNFIIEVYLSPTKPHFSMREKWNQPLLHLKSYLSLL